MKKNKWVLLILVLTLWGCQGTEQTNGSEKVDATPESKEETEVETLPVKREDFTGAWANPEFIFYIDEDTVYLQNKENQYLNAYSIVDESLQPDTLILGFGENTDEHSIRYLKEPNALNFTLKDDSLEIWDDEGIQFSSLRKNEEELDERFLTYIETDGEVGELYYQGPDLTIEDFTGYWVPMDNFHHIDDKLTELGDFYFWMDDQFTTTLVYNESVDIQHIQEYEIRGNTLYTTEEAFDGGAMTAFQEGTSRQVNRTVLLNEMTLFQEADRDRLVFGSGLVLQRASSDEILAAFGASDGETFHAFGNMTLESYEALEEGQYTIETLSTKVEEANPLNYPYSVGKLSESQLYNEHQILLENIEHPETDVPENQAIKQLFSAPYESTPAYNETNLYDQSYSFSDLEGQDTLVIAGGTRTYWRSQPQWLEISNVSYAHPIYTVEYQDTNHSLSGTLRFYRINDQVIYAEDDYGEFTRRLEQDTDWYDYHGMPFVNN